MSSTLVSDAMRHASFNMVFQMSTRITTFLLNIYTLRYISAYTLGVINVRLLLLYTTTQFISREPMRRVCISEAKSNRWPALINLIWLNICVSFLSGYGLSYIWLNWIDQPEVEQAFGYRFAVLVMPIIVAIEMISEPMFIYCQLQNLVKIRINIEAITLVIRCIIMALFVQSYPMHAVIIFIFSLFISSIALTIMYHTYFAFKLSLNLSYSQFFPNLNIQPIFDTSLLKLNFSFLLQTIIKQFLTEGEKFIMTFLNPMTFDDQGIFDIVNNLGSLAARFIFQPIEESAYILFGKLVVRGKHGNQDRKKFKMAIETLRNLFKLMSLCGLIVFTFGFNYSQLGLKIYNEKHLGHGLAIILMRFHCIYIYFAAINGVSETFTFAVMSKEQLDKFNIWLIAFSVIYLVVSSLATTLVGASGLILANCVNMSCRILFSCSFIQQECIKNRNSENPVFGILPHPKVLAAFSVIFGLTRLSETILCCSHWGNSIVHVIFGAILLFLILRIIYRYEPFAIEMMNHIPLFRFFFKFVQKPKTN